MMNIFEWMCIVCVCVCDCVHWTNGRTDTGRQVHKIEYYKLRKSLKVCTVCTFVRVAANGFGCTYMRAASQSTSAHHSKRFFPDGFPSFPISFSLWAENKYAHRFWGICAKIVRTCSNWTMWPVSCIAQCAIRKFRIFCVCLILHLT